MTITINKIIKSLKDGETLEKHRSYYTARYGSGMMPSYWFLTGEYAQIIEKEMIDRMLKKNLIKVEAYKRSCPMTSPDVYKRAVLVSNKSLNPTQTQGPLP